MIILLDLFYHFPSPRKSSGKKGSFLNSLSDTLEESFDRKNVDSSNVKLDITSRGPKLLVCCVCLGDVSHEDDEIGEEKFSFLFERKSSYSSALLT